MEGTDVGVRSVRRGPALLGVRAIRHGRAGIRDEYPWRVFAATGQ